MTTRNAASSILTVLGVVVALRLGRDFLMPVALAALLGFWLSPVVARLERWRLPRAGAVLLVTTLLGAVVVSGGWYAGRQLSALPENLPTYRANLLTKLQTIRRPLGALERVGRVFDEVEREISGAAPQTVVVERAGGLALATGLAAPLVAPMGTAAAVAILVLFSLLERESLRDRMLAIVGGDDLAAATSAIDDATFRLSRYLGAQSLLCAAHGILVGAGLFALGVPTAWLFGLLAGLLRFVPYLGPWVAAALPVAVSIAAFPGWLPALGTVVLFITLETISNNVFEPWIYGTSAGLSPFAVVVSAFFWTWLWGLPGLFLATPLTVCAVVAGRYVRALAFVRTLLGDEPPLEPAARLYQRLLALDAGEAAAILRAAVERTSLCQASDDVVLPALRRISDALERGAVDDDKLVEMRGTFEAILAASAGRREAQAGRAVAVRVGTGSAEALTRRWLEFLLAENGLRIDPVSPPDDESVVCISALSVRGLREAIRSAERPTGVVLCLDQRQAAAGREASARGRRLMIARRSVDLVRRLHSRTRRAGPTGSAVAEPEAPERPC